ncbi:SNARE-like protein [Salinisphaera sp. T5B8]|uniref:TVP38/TMEM64 family protein n=1 Tax=Salinisphaera sp. T5B8 TaxID=1304154 RepID=UPI0033423298
MSQRRWQIVAGVSLFGAFAVAALVLWQTGLLAQALDGEALERLVIALGPAGPALIVSLMTMAIVMSPIPSAPIALAAGAAYGHGWGTLYVAVGAETGALIAFGIARLVGYEALRARLGERVDSTGLLNRFITSQNTLMAVVFATRLLPFISFDVISYAAGLTPLALWRFAVATLLGILPASFVLAHFGDELATGDLHGAVLTVLALGLVTLLPLVWRALPLRFRTATRHWFGSRPGCNKR